MLKPEMAALPPLTGVFSLGRRLYPASLARIQCYLTRSASRGGERRVSINEVSRASRKGARKTVYNEQMPTCCAASGIYPFPAGGQGGSFHPMRSVLYSSLPSQSFPSDLDSSICSLCAGAVMQLLLRSPEWNRKSLLCTLGQSKQSSRAAECCEEKEDVVQSCDDVIKPIPPILTACRPCFPADMCRAS